MKQQVLTLTLAAFVAAAVGTISPTIAQAQDQSQPIPGDAGAQPQGSEGHAQRHRPDPNRQVRRMAKELKLSSDQQSKILPILTDRASQMDAIRGDNTLAQGDRRSKMKMIREDSETKIRALLTDDQKQKYDQMQQHMRERMQQQHGQ